MTDEKRERLNALSEKMKEHAERSGNGAAGAVKPGGQRLAPGAQTASGGVKPTASSGVKPTAAAGVKPTASSGVKPTAATGVKPTTASVKPAAAGKAVNFTDVPDGAYYADAVQWAVQQGITSGTTETTFTPDNPCHRGHAATFLWRFLGQPKPRSTSNPFKDVSDGPFYQAILWASWANVIPGTSITTFEHTKPCTRREVLTYIMRAQGSANATEDEAVKWAAHKSLLTGITGGVDAVCTRADIVTFLYRLRKK